MKRKNTCHINSGLKTTFKVGGVVLGIFGVGSLIYSVLSRAINEGFGPSRGCARSFSEISPLNINNSGLLAGGCILGVAGITTIVEAFIKD